MEGDESRPGSRRATPKCSVTSLHSRNISSAVRAGSVGRSSRNNPSGGRAERGDPDATPQSSRPGVRSFDDRLLGADDEFNIPRRLDGRRGSTDDLAAALSKPVSDALSDILAEVVKAQLVDLTKRVVEVVCDVQVEVAQACMKDMYQELAVRLMGDLGQLLENIGTQAVVATHTLQIPALSVTPAMMANSMSAAPSMVSAQVSRASSLRRGASKGTITSSSDDTSSRDVKTLENTLADQLLEDLGLSCTQPSPRGRRKKSRGFSDAASGVSSSSLAPVVPSQMEHSRRHVPSSSLPGAAEVCPKDSESIQSVGEHHRTSFTLPSAALITAGASEAAAARVSTAGSTLCASSSQQAPASREDTAWSLVVPTPPTIQDLTPPQTSALVVAMDLPNTVRAPESDDGRNQANSCPRTISSSGELPHDDGEVNLPRSLGRAAKSGKRMTTGEVLRVRIEELTEEIPIIDPSTYDESEVAKSEVGGTESTFFLSLKVCGLTPWSAERCPGGSRAYRVFTLCVAAVVACALLAEAVTKRETLLQVTSTCEGSQTCWRQRGLLNEIPLAVSLVVGLVVLGVWRTRMALVNTLLLLESYSLQQGLTEKLLSRRRRETRWAAVLSICAVVFGFAGLYLDSQGQPLRLEVVLSYIAQAVTFLMLLSICFCLLYICSVLGMCADAFCCNVVDDLDLGAVVHEWNVLQAILRKSSSTIELAFVAFMCAIMFYIPLLMVDFFALRGNRDALPSLVPGLVVCIGIIRLFFLAAAITDKCTRIPPLMNSLSFGPGTERYRQYIVDYITNSAAGFYVFDVRLSTGMVLKFIYVWGVVAFGLSTQLFSQR